MLKTLESLNKIGYVHLDIKPENFLLDKYNDLVHCMVFFGLFFLIHHSFHQFHMIDKVETREPSFQPFFHNRLYIHNSKGQAFDGE